MGTDSATAYPELTTPDVVTKARTTARVAEENLARLRTDETLRSALVDRALERMPELILPGQDPAQLAELLRSNAGLAAVYAACERRNLPTLPAAYTCWRNPSDSRQDTGISKSKAYGVFPDMTLSDVLEDMVKTSQKVEDKQHAIAISSLVGARVRGRKKANWARTDFAVLDCDGAKDGEYLALYQRLRAAGIGTVIGPSGGASEESVARGSPNKIHLVVPFAEPVRAPGIDPQVGFLAPDDRPRSGVPAETPEHREAADLYSLAYVTVLIPVMAEVAGMVRATGFRRDEEHSDSGWDPATDSPTNLFFHATKRRPDQTWTPAPRVTAWGDALAVSHRRLLEVVKELWERALEYHRKRKDAWSGDDFDLARVPRSITPVIELAPDPEPHVAAMAGVLGLKPAANQSSAAKKFARTISALERTRPDRGDARQALTVRLAKVLPELGLSDLEAEVVIGRGLRRSDPVAVQHAIRSTKLRTQQGAPVAGRRAILRSKGGYRLLGELALALAEDLGVDQIDVWRRLISQWAPAGRGPSAKRALDVLKLIPPDHRYRTMVEGLIPCGFPIHRECAEHGPQGIALKACRRKVCVECAWREAFRVREGLRSLWALEVDGVECYESREFGSKSEAKDWYEKAAKPVFGPHRWQLVLRGVGRWTVAVWTRKRQGVDPGRLRNSVPPRFLRFLGDPERPLATPPPGWLGSHRSWKDPKAAADHAVRLLLTTRNVIVDLFMHEWDVFEVVMADCHDKNSHYGTQGALPWPKRGERYEAGGDLESEDGCGSHCVAAGQLSYKTLEPVTGKQLLESRYEPSCPAIVRSMRCHGVFSLESRDSVVERQRACGERKLRYQYVPDPSGGG